MIPLLSAAAFAAGMTARAPAVRDFRSPAARGVAADVANVRGARDLGALAATHSVRIGVLMRFRHEGELARLTDLQGQRRSPYYHRYLTTAQWNDYFAPDAATYGRAASSLQRNGFRIERAYANRGFVVASGTAAAAARYFRTEFHAYYVPGRGLRYANVRPAVMPAELRDIAVSVSGLHDAVALQVPHRALAHRGQPIPAARAMALAAQRAATFGSTGPRQRFAATPSPKPITTSTPAPNPRPDPTESPNKPSSDYLAATGGYGPPIFAIAYDYPVQHGYGGRGHAAGTVIDSDFSDTDMANEFAAFIKQPHAGKQVRVCTDPNNQCTICDPTNFATTCDPIGESTLDAEAIATLAPDADLYEYLVNSKTGLVDVNVNAAYERVVSDNVVDAVNSSFGGCETDDPSFEYSTNYIAMEGAAKGITFASSTGDTGAFNCGVYTTNGAPQTFSNASIPSADYYFTAVGGTVFEVVPDRTTTYYNAERAWQDGGGGYSVYEPLPSWQAAAVSGGLATSYSTKGRNTPDLSLTADGGPAFIGGTEGVGLIIMYNGSEQGSGGTSLSSPMWVAMQTSINHVQGSRNGWVNPRLYQILGNSAAYAFAFRDIVSGNNMGWQAVPGYDDATGIGSPKGWELAGTE